MPHFMSLVDNTCLGALNFTDGDMNPIERVLTIKGVEKRKPPAGNKEKPCIVWVETPKVSFLPTGQLKALANKLMVADTDRWVGAKVTLTCGPVKSPKGGETMGVIVVKAEKPRGQQPATVASKQTETIQTTEPNPEDDGRE
jgi:hypothetical protein